MFNFKAMNRALNDSNLSDKAFRMLYTITNYCSLKNSNSVEVHNAHLMMVLNISERWVRKITNELVEKGYITKKVNGTSQNKLANTYTLIDVEVNDTPTDSLCNDINKDAQKFHLTDRGNNKGNKSDAQKFPLKNNNKINKNNNIFLSNNINIPDTNTDNSDEVFLSNFMKVDNINVDNSNAESENLKIEIRNMNKENVMNEERMNGMNNINNSNKTDINNSTKSLEDILTEQSDEFNDIIQFVNNLVVDTDEADTSDKSMNISVEEQERYSRLFDKCKSQIEIWSKTHDYACISIFDAYYKTIQSMNDEHLITPKQWNTAKRYLFERFNNLRNGYNNYIQKKNKNISSNEISECNTPQPPRPEENENKAVLSHKNAQDNKTISQSKETQQDANKRAKMAIVEMGDEFKDEYNRISTVINGNYNVMDIAKEMENYFNLCRNCNDWNLCVKWYDTLELIINKYADWFKCGDLANAIYSIANPIMDNKNNDLNK